MSDSVPASVPPSVPPTEQPSERPGTSPAATARKRAALGRLLPRGKGARWAVAGAAVVIAGGAATAVAVVEHHHDRPFGGPRAVWSVPGHDGGFGRGPAGPEEPGPVGPGERGEHAAGEREQRRLLKGDGRAETVRPDAARPDGAGQAAPAPLPALAIGAAAEKAAAAVTGGKVESMRVVAQEGGGSAWRAVVLGPDGVRHAVTVSGADGTVTSNTTIGR
ncbi:hypothetical protein ACWFQ8_13455 [Streptomyces sp. NPDC055254]